MNFQKLFLMSVLSLNLLSLGCKSSGGGGADSDPSQAPDKILMDAVKNINKCYYIDTISKIELLRDCSSSDQNLSLDQLYQMDKYYPILFKALEDYKTWYFTRVTTRNEYICFSRCADDRDAFMEVKQFFEQKRTGVLANIQRLEKEAADALLAQRLAEEQLKLDIENALLENQNTIEGLKKEINIKLEALKLIASDCIEEVEGVICSYDVEGKTFEQFHKYRLAAGEYEEALMKLAIFYQSIPVLASYSDSPSKLRREQKIKTENITSDFAYILRSKYNTRIRSFKESLEAKINSKIIIHSSLDQFVMSEVESQIEKLDRQESILLNWADRINAINPKEILIYEKKEFGSFVNYNLTRSEFLIKSVNCVFATTNFNSNCIILGFSLDTHSLTMDLLEKMTEWENKDFDKAIAEKKIILNEVPLLINRFYSAVHNLDFHIPVYYNKPQVESFIESLNDIRLFKPIIEATIHYLQLHMTSLALEIEQQRHPDVNLSGITLNFYPNVSSRDQLVTNESEVTINIGPWILENGGHNRYSLRYIFRQLNK